MPYQHRTKPEKKIYAKSMREKPTKAESALWDSIEQGGLGRPKPVCKRQEIILGYIVDFYFPDSRLVVELDGKIHEHTKSYDAKRDAAMTSRRLRVLRFKNHEVLDDINQVLVEIAKAIAYTHPSWNETTLCKQLQKIRKKDLLTRLSNIRYNQFSSEG